MCVCVCVCVQNDQSIKLFNLSSLSFFPSRNSTTTTTTTTTTTKEDEEEEGEGEEEGEESFTEFMWNLQGEVIFFPVHLATREVYIVRVVIASGETVKLRFTPRHFRTTVGQNIQLLWEQTDLDFTVGQWVFISDKNSTCSDIN